jgi:hypothetical protein
MQAGTVERVGEEIFAAIAASGTAGDDQLSSLHFLFDSHFAKALQIVDQGGVFCFVGASSGRRVYQVRGHSSEDYVVFPGHYCSCQVRACGSRAGGPPGLPVGPGAPLPSAATAACRLPAASLKPPAALHRLAAARGRLARRAERFAEVINQEQLTGEPCTALTAATARSCRCR